MSEMIERVAKAISGAPFPSPASYRKARAAIEAMREPSAAMVDAGENFDVTVDADGIWRVMLDAALPIKP